MVFKKKNKIVVPEKKIINYGNSFPTVEMIKKEKNALGQKELIKFIKDEQLNLRESIYAYCYDCSGYYSDGITDCGCKRCPLYPFMPYSPIKPILRKRKV